MQQLDFTLGRLQAESELSNIDGLQLVGIELVLGRLFDTIGFNQILDLLFRQLVLSRLCYPVSKLKTTDYLHCYYHQFIDVHQIIVIWINFIKRKSRRFNKSATHILLKFCRVIYPLYSTMLLRFILR